MDSNDNWECLEEANDIHLSSPPAELLSQLTKLWYMHGPSVNRRLAGIQLLEFESLPAQLTEKIVIKLKNCSSSALELAASNYELLTEPRLVRFVPKCHYHHSFSQNCYEMAAIYKPIQLDELVAGQENPPPNPNIEREYAFQLVQSNETNHQRFGPVNSADEPTTSANSSSPLWTFRLLCRLTSPQQKLFMHKWVWPRLVKWLRSLCSGNANMWTQQETANLLLDPERYVHTYWHLKLEHGRPIVEKWQKQSMVFEQCAIAAYLLELWNAYGIGPHLKFAVLPCRKGLLVHLLTSQGHAGFGLDSKARKCWTELQHLGTQLKEVSLLQPQSAEWVGEHLAGVDFLVGAHCNQLDPWLPLIAARLGCNFFLLPTANAHFCDRFIKQQADQPQLLEQYYAFLEWICVQLGFEVAVDRLRIPSRRQKCLIGTVPAHGLPKAGLERLEPMTQKILNAMQPNSPSSIFSIQSKLQIQQPKMTSEKREELARKIVEFLIRLEPNERINDWHCRGTASICALAQQLLDKEDRELLEDQPGGLQTFLRNQHQLFLVNSTSNGLGLVSLRKWPLVFGEFLQKAGSKTTFGGVSAPSSGCIPKGVLCPLVGVHTNTQTNPVKRLMTLFISLHCLTLNCDKRMKMII